MRLILTTVGGILFLAGGVFDPQTAPTAATPNEVSFANAGMRQTVPTSHADVPETRPEAVLQTGHSRAVQVTVFNPKGQWLASGSKDNTIKIWDLNTGNVLRTLYGHTSDINSLAVSPDGTILASGSGRVYEERDAKYFYVGGQVGGGQEDTSVRIWDVATGRELRILSGHVLPVTSLAFSPDSRTVVSASSDVIKVWEVASGKELKSINVSSTKYETPTFRKVLTLGAASKEFKEYDQMRTRLLKFKNSTTQIAMDARGQFVAAGVPGKSFTIFDVEQGRELRNLEFKATADFGNSIAFSPDGQLLAYATSGEAVRLEDVARGRELRTLSTSLPKTTRLQAHFSADGKCLLIVGNPDNDAKHVQMWDVATGQRLREVEIHDNRISRLIDLSPDNKLVAIIADGSSGIDLFDMETGREVRDLRTSRLGANSTSDQPAESLQTDDKLAKELHKRGQNNEEKLMEEEADIGSFSNKYRSADAVAFSADGRWLVSKRNRIGYTSMETWDTSTGIEVRSGQTAKLKDIGNPDFSPDGRFKVTAVYEAEEYAKQRKAFSFRSFEGSSLRGTHYSYKQKAILYDTKSYRKLHTFEVGSAPDVGFVPAVGFSLDGGLIALAGFADKKNEIVVFSTQDGKRIAGFPSDEDQHTEPVTALAVRTDKPVIAASSGSRIDLFDLSTGKNIRTLLHSGGISALSFNPSGRYLAGLGKDGEIYLWDTQSGELVATLVALKGTNANSGSTDWLVVTPDGLFDGSPSAWGQILWRFGQSTFNVVPVETFFNEFYYPGLLSEIIAGKKPRAPRDLGQVDRRLPTVTIAAADSRFDARGNVESREFTVNLNVTEAPPDPQHSQGSGAQDVRLFRNGALVHVWRGDVLKSESKRVLQAKISMVAGQNVLTAYAFNHENVKSTDARLEIGGGESLRRRGIIHIISVGINKYENGEYDLRYAVPDATAVTNQLKLEQTKVGTYEIETTSLFDNDATKRNILLALRRLAGKPEESGAPEVPSVLSQIRTAQPEDVVIFYYAGHGTSQGQRFFLIPHDLGYVGGKDEINESAVETILSHSISDRALEEAFQELDAGKILLVIDACNSGQALEAEEKRRGPMNSKGLAQLAYEKGMYILTASQSYQAALEAAPLGHGLLTYALVEEGLKQGKADDQPRDGKITDTEWLDYATERVPALQTEEMRKAEQRGVKLAFVRGEEQIADSEMKTLQRPRVFYRRESQSDPLILWKQ
jgi:WD40 repeat protein/uncharacterized caspase-like protein